MKATLTEREHARVASIMGSVADGGHRVCRCGARVRWTPDELWQHTLACEKRQQQEARATREAVTA